MSEQNFDWQFDLLAIAVAFILAPTLIGPAKAVVEYKSKRGERAKIVCDAYAKHLDKLAREDMREINICEYIQSVLPDAQKTAAEDSLIWRNELQGFFDKNVYKIFNPNDFNTKPNQITDVSYLNDKIANKARKNKRFAQQKYDYDFISKQYRNSVKHLILSRQQRTK